MWLALTFMPIPTPLKATLRSWPRVGQGPAASSLQARGELSRSWLDSCSSSASVPSHGVSA